MHRCQTSESVFNKKKVVYRTGKLSWEVACVAATVDTVGGILPVTVVLRRFYEVLEESQEIQAMV